MTVAQLLADRFVLSDTDWNHWPDGWSDSQIWEFAARAGLGGIEVGVYDVATELSPARHEERRRLAARHGIDVSALLLSLPRARWPRGALAATGDELTQLLVQVSGCAAVCQELGLSVLGLWPGADVLTGPNPREADAWRRAVHGLSLAREAAGEHGVRLAVEYKPGTVVASVEDALALAEAVPGTGVLLDTGHAWAAGEDPAESLRQLRAAGILWAVHLGDATVGGSDDDLPLGREHPVDALLAELRQGPRPPTADGGPVTASFDLYGVVEGGALTGEAAVRESLAALEAVPR